MSVDVVALDPGREAAWTGFLADRPESLAYQTLWYRDLLAEHLGAHPEYLLAVRDGAVVGALPTMWSDGPRAGVLNALPYYGSNGAITATDDEAAQALLGAWDDLAATAVSATLVANPFDERPAPVPEHTHVDERINQATPLPADAGDDPTEAILAAIDSSARRNVRKAWRTGLEVASDAGAMDDLHRIHVANMADIGGLAKDRSFFATLERVAGAGSEYDVFAGRLDGEVVAAVLVLWHGEVAEYFTPVVSHDHRGDQPLAAVLVAAIGEAMQRRCRWFNWGGTWVTQQGVYRFKRKWGARDAHYRYHTRLNDEAVLDATPTELRERYGAFFVVPFDALRSQGATP